MNRRLLPIILLLALLPVAPVVACIWDYDTLRDEQRGLPTVAAILAGKWERHSDFFYDQRIERMRAHLQEHPEDLPALDNLAVALEKRGQVDEAISLMQEKLELADDDQFPHYTTHANLGTFYLHRWGAEGDTGDLDRGIEHIKEALAINPDAHFGREEYQLQVAEYLREAQDDSSILDRGSFIVPMLVDLEEVAEDVERRHADWVERQGSPESEPTMPSDIRREMEHQIRFTTSFSSRPPATVDPAIEGIVGMIRFGTGTSPHLYYALGDLLAARGDKHLATRAYLRALEYNHPRPEQVEEAIAQLVEVIYDSELEEIRTEFEQEKQAAVAWVAAYQAYEDDLVRQGADLNDEASYAAFYAEHGDARADPGFSLTGHMPRGPFGRALLFLGSILLGGLVLIVALVWFLRRRKRRRAATAFG